MEVSPYDPAWSTTVSQFVHRTRDGGAHWERISPDLTAHPEGTQAASGEPITRDATAKSLQHAVFDPRIARAEGVSGRAPMRPIHVSRDDGKTWTT